jgi:hypothetical protein
MLFVCYKVVVVAHAHEALKWVKFKFLGRQKINVGRNGENPPTHISNPPLHFESNYHLSLGFLHPLGF